MPPLGSWHLEPAVSSDAPSVARCLPFKTHWHIFHATCQAGIFPFGCLFCCHLPSPLPLLLGKLLLRHWLVSGLADSTRQLGSRWRKCVSFQLALVLRRAARQDPSAAL